MASNGSGAARLSTDVQPLPSFFLVGPPRTGTTWLHSVLAEHTTLPVTKETRFFDLHFHRGLDWYRAHFRVADRDRKLGEIAPTYFASAAARERMARELPSARIVCIFRDPVDRVVSLYRLKRAYGMIPWDFEEALIRDPELIESGRYASHLKAWQQSFGCNQVLPTLYDDLREQPAAYVDALADFIGIPRFELTPSQMRHVHASEFMTEPRNYLRTRSATFMADWFKARRLHRIVAAVKTSPLINLFLGGGPAFAEISRELLMSVYELFRPEVEELETLLNRDLSAWKANQCFLAAVPEL
jgi:hypothetical protein